MPGSPSTGFYRANVALKDARAARDVCELRQAYALKPSIHGCGEVRGFGQLRIMLASMNNTMLTQTELA